MDGMTDRPIDPLTGPGKAARRLTERTAALALATARQVHIRAQISWVIQNPSLWHSCKGAFEDPFDALEEMACALFRDEMGKSKGSDILGQRSTGFSAVETEVVPNLRTYAERFGVEVGAGAADGGARAPPCRATPSPRLA